MEEKLSRESEQKLLFSMKETLLCQKQLLQEAILSMDSSQIRKIGHHLKGNSGALYFKMDRFRSIGKYLEDHSDLPKDQLLHVLTQMDQLIDEIDRYMLCT